MFENLNSSHNKIGNNNFPGIAFSNLEVKFFIFTLNSLHKLGIIAFEIFKPLGF
jgi:hypothetical protein